MSDGLFPALEPYEVSWLEADGHRIRYEQCGNPVGIPVVFLHGGPGSSINSNHRRFYDPAMFRIVLFDQRGCGQSTPRGGTASNTTQLLVQDIEQLRVALGAERWLLFGGSWGSTLALAYAQAYPTCVRGLVLRGVFLASDDEVAWFLVGLRRFVPQAWEAFTLNLSDRSAAGILHDYSARMEAGDVDAAQRWNVWENAVMAIGEAASAGGAMDAAAALARVRVQLHYLINDSFLAPDQLLNGVPALAHLPAIIVQGRHDMVCPPEAAYKLALAWPGAQLRMIENGGHAATNPAISSALAQAVQDIRPRL
ncbi:MAG: prolyl aminopeptidase [Betaproteobacteria bacterium]